LAPVVLPVCKNFYRFA